ncbi:hypothetical protein PYX08_01925 [Citrobacter freundii]|nr:hypothetical protein [Citrobacter freundii]
MTFDEYMNKTHSINEQLQDIATRTKNLALLGQANASNSNFANLMRLHANLTEQSRKMTEDMMNQLQIDN